MVSQQTYGTTMEDNNEFASMLRRGESPFTWSGRPGRQESPDTLSLRKGVTYRGRPYQAYSTVDGRESPRDWRRYEVGPSDEVDDGSAPVDDAPWIMSLAQDRTHARARAREPAHRCATPRGSQYRN